MTAFGTQYWNIPACWVSVATLSNVDSFASLNHSVTSLYTSLWGQHITQQLLTSYFPLYEILLRNMNKNSSQEYWELECKTKKRNKIKNKTKHNMTRNKHRRYAALENKHKAGGEDHSCNPVMKHRKWAHAVDMSQSSAIFIWLNI